MKSRKDAIDQHCKDCIYDPVNGKGSWRQQVKNCTALTCALFDFRPKACFDLDEALSELEISKKGENRPSTDHCEGRSA